MQPVDTYMRSRRESQKTMQLFNIDDVTIPRLKIDEKNGSYQKPSRQFIVWSTIACSMIFIASRSVISRHNDVKYSGLHSNMSSASRDKRHFRRRNREMIFNFEYLTAEDIYDRLHELKREYPQFVDLTSAQDAYNLPTTGNEYDCPFEETRPGCHNWILTIHDKVQNHTVQQKLLPEVFLSGALHGDEWVGPTTVMETIDLLLDAATCESMPQRYTFDGTRLDDEEYQSQIEQARQCRQALVDRGVFPVHRKWLARLVSTRRIIVVPTANALGYFKGIREEGDAGGDPNRDFPYDQTNSTDCLNTIAARTIYYLLNEHAVQLGITFHGGMQAVGYEWGAPSHKGEIAPDVASQRQISELYRRFGGEFVEKDGNEYPTGPMNDLVYPVHGGMEDWSYAASWDRSLVTKRCTPSKNGGLNSKDQSVPSPESLRMFMALVETSDDKKPKPDSLGTNEDIFTPFGQGNGHISRNIRLSLAMLDTVEPYASILGINGVELWDDVIPLSPRAEDSCTKTKVVSVPHGTETVAVQWTVGGAFTVDATSLWYAPWENLQIEDSPFNCVTQPSRDELELFFKNNPEVIRMTETATGRTHWHEEIPFPMPEEEALHPLDAIFSAEVDLRSLKVGERIAVFAVARVDQDWREQGGSKLLPQTHLARVRTDPEWHFETDGKDQSIQGRLDWFSIPLTIEIGPAGSKVFEKSVRDPLDEWMGDDDFELNIHLVLGAFVFAVVVCLCVKCREKGNGEELWTILRNRKLAMLPLDDPDENVKDLELSSKREIT